MYSVMSGTFSDIKLGFDKHHSYRHSISAVSHRIGKLNQIDKLLAIMCSWVPLSILKYMYNLL